MPPLYIPNSDSIIPYDRVASFYHHAGTTDVIYSRVDSIAPTLYLETRVLLRKDKAIKLIESYPFTLSTSKDKVPLYDEELDAALAEYALDLTAEKEKVQVIARHLSVVTQSPSAVIKQGSHNTKLLYPVSQVKEVVDAWLNSSFVALDAKLRLQESTHNSIIIAAENGFQLTISIKSNKLVIKSSVLHGYDNQQDTDIRNLPTSLDLIAALSVKRITKILNQLEYLKRGGI
jgi:hypothetical protein